MPDATEDWDRIESINQFVGMIRIVNAGLAAMHGYVHDAMHHTITEDEAKALRKDIWDVREALGHIQDKLENTDYNID